MHFAGGAGNGARAAGRKAGQPAPLTTATESCKLDGSRRNGRARIFENMGSGLGSEAERIEMILLEAKAREHQASVLVRWTGMPSSLGARGDESISGQAKVGRTVDALARTGEEGRDKLR